MGWRASKIAPDCALCATRRATRGRHNCILERTGRLNQALSQTRAPACVCADARQPDGRRPGRPHGRRGGNCASGVQPEPVARPSVCRERYHLASAVAATLGLAGRATIAAGAHLSGPQAHSLAHPSVRPQHTRPPERSIECATGEQPSRERPSDWRLAERVARRRARKQQLRGGRDPRPRSRRPTG